MNGGRPRSSLYLIIRSLVPSGISGVICVCFAVLITGTNMMLLSLSSGTSLPNLFDGQWGLLYTNYVVGPIERFINNLLVTNVMAILLWGLLGLFVYILGEYLAHLTYDWWHAQHDMAFGRDRRMLLHPARRSFVVSATWRLGVVIIAICAFVAAQPLMQRAFAANPKIILGDVALSEAVRQISTALIIWAVLAHVFVVVLRLFLMRTRLFGDPDIQ